MTNTSATGGYLLPADSPAPLEDDGLVDFLQLLIVGVSGFADPSLVRPRWQPSPPQQPDNTTDWMALGIQNRKGDTFAYEAHLPDGDGTDFVQRNEEFELLLSVYGPNADKYTALIREGLSVGQNREVLQLACIGLIGVGNILPAPEQYNNQWYYRLDMVIGFRRQIIRLYPILNILSAMATLIARADPTITKDINVTNT